MAPTLVERGSIRGPQGPTGPPGATGAPGRTFDPEGTVATSTALLALDAAPGQAWHVVDSGRLYVFEGDDAAAAGEPGHDPDVPGWTDLGRIKGDPGEQGDPGAQGDPGPRGEQGVQGVKGEQGEQGVAGVAGEQGAPGERGERGPEGVQGQQGVQGVKGDPGEQGTPGQQGVQGVQGLQGERGPAGVAGSRIWSYGGSTGRTQAQALALAAIGDVLIDLDAGTYYDVADV